MLRKSAFTLLVITLWVFTHGFSLDAANAQTLKKRKHRKFGSSLSNLKWDPKLRRAADATSSMTPGPKENQQFDDAITLRSSLAVFNVLVTDQHSRSVSGLSKDD